MMQSDISTKQERGRFYTINSMIRAILHHSGISGKSADVVMAIIGCMPGDGTDHKAIHLAAIGAKMAGSSREKKAREQRAARGIGRLQREQQISGLQLISITGGAKDADNLQLTSTFQDHLTPTAQRALLSIQWDTAKTRAEKGKLFEQAALDAIASLPQCQPNDTAKDKVINRLPVATYMTEGVDRKKVEGTKFIDRLLYDYSDPSAAAAAAAQLAQHYSELAIKIKRHHPAAIAPYSVAGIHDSTASPPPPPDVSSRDGLLETCPDQGKDGGRMAVNHLAKMNSIQTTPSYNLRVGLPHNSSEQRIYRPVNSDVTLQWGNLMLNRFGAVLLSYGVNQHGQCTCGKDCQSIGKHPISGTIKGIIRDAHQLERELERHPGSNLGLVTGEATNISVLDFDGAIGVEIYNQWIDEGLIRADLLTAHTGGGGVHVLLRYQPTWKSVSLGGLDIKGRNGQIITAPSLHRSGKQYQWRNWTDGLVIDASDQLIERIHDLSKTPTQHTRQSTQMHTTITRNDDQKITDGRKTMIFKRASGLVGKGYTKEAVRKIVHQVNREQCSPPLDPTFVDKKINEVEKQYRSRHQ
jgi:putative DNA primase/helicase